MKIYFTRHGETLWNKEGKLQGWMNSELTEQGIKNAKKVGEHFKDIELDKIFSSPLGRAYETAIYARGTKKTEIITKDYLKEMGFGVLEGMDQYKVDEQYSEDLFRFWNQPHLYRAVKDGESFEKLFNRAKEGLKDILESSRGCENILIVSHAVLIKAMFAIIKELPIEHIWAPPFQKNNCLSILEVNEGRMELVLEGDVSHLD